MLASQISERIFTFKPQAHLTSPDPADAPPPPRLHDLLLLSYARLAPYRPVPLRASTPRSLTRVYSLAPYGLTPSDGWCRTFLLSTAYTCAHLRNISSDYVLGSVVCESDGVVCESDGL